MGGGGKGEGGRGWEREGEMSSRLELNIVQFI